MPSLDILETGNLGLNTGGIGGKVIVNAVTLTTNKGDVVSLIGRYKQITINESIFSSAIEGNIVLSDTSGFFEQYVLCGGETITLIFSDKTNKEIIIGRADLVVHRISESPIDKISLTNTYTLFFTSKNYVRSLKKRVFKSYKNRTLSQIVKEIYSYTVEPGKENVHLINIFDSSSVNIKDKPFISTGLSPYKAIEYLSKRACGSPTESSYGGKFFVFFERLIPSVGPNNTIYSHHFGSVNQLIKGADFKTGTTRPIYNIVYVPNRFGNIESNKPNTLRTSKVVKLSGFNHIDAMMTGLYSSRITAIDPITKTYNKFGIFYDSLSVVGDFYNQPLLPEGSIFATYNRDGAEVPEVPGEKLIFSSTDTNNYHAEFITKFSWLPSHIVGQISKNLFKIRVTIDGGTNAISVGNIINFRIVSHVRKTLDPQNPFIEDDRIYSGKYLVTDIKHTIVGDDYLKEVDLARGTSKINLKSQLSAEDLSTINILDDLQRDADKRKTEQNKNTTDQAVQIDSEKTLSDIVNSYLQILSSNNIATYTKNISILSPQNREITFQRQFSNGFPTTETSRVIEALGISIDSGGNYSENSYKVFAALMKKGDFRTFGEVFTFFYPGNINLVITKFGEIRTVAGVQSTYLKQSIIDSIRIYL